MADTRLTNQIRSKSKNVFARRHVRVGRGRHSKEVPRRLLVQQIKQNAVGEFDGGRAISLGVRVLRSIGRGGGSQVRVTICLKRQVGWGILECEHALLSDVQVEHQHVDVEGSVGQNLGR